MIATGEEPSPARPLATLRIGRARSFEEGQEAANARAGAVVAVLRCDHRDARRQRLHLDDAGTLFWAKITQPPTVRTIGNDHVERAVGVGCNIRERGGGGGRIGVIQRFQHQLAAAAESFRRTQRVHAIGDCGDDALRIDAKPASASEKVDAGHYLRSIRPVPARSTPGPILHLVAVSADENGPVMARPKQKDNTAHFQSSAAWGLPYRPL